MEPDVGPESAKGPVTDPAAALL